MAGITVAYVVITAFLVWVNKNTNDLSKKYNEESLRPVVTVNLTVSNAFIVLRFSNEGKRTAEDVHVDFDYPLTEEPMFNNKQKMLLNSTFNIVPGDAWDLQIQHFIPGSSYEKMESKTIAVSYHDKSNDYRENTVINFASLSWANHPCEKISTNALDHGAL